MEDYLSAEQLIVDRLKNALNLADKEVFGMAEFDPKKGMIADFTAQVIYLDDIVPSAGNSRTFGGVSQISHQHWLIVPGIRNVNDSQGVSARRAMGDKAVKVLKALQGWSPSNEHGGMVRQQAPFRASYINGYLYLPFVFSTQIIIIGEM